MDRYGRVRSAVEPSHPKPRCQQWRIARPIASALKRLSLEFRCAVQFDAPERGGPRPRARAAACGIGGAQRREYRAECRRVQARQAPLAAHAGLVRLQAGACLSAPTQASNAIGTQGNAIGTNKHAISSGDQTSDRRKLCTGRVRVQNLPSLLLLCGSRCVALLCSLRRCESCNNAASARRLDWLRMGSGSSNVRFCATSSSTMPAGCTPSASRCSVQRA